MQDNGLKQSQFQNLNKNMKVLHIITSLSDGGAEAVLYRMCKFDKSNTHTVISLMNEQKYVSMLKKIGINVFTLNFSNRRVNLKGMVKLYRIIKQIEPDVVQTWLDHADLVGGVIAKFAGKKNIVWGVHHSELKRGESKLSTIFISRINALMSYFIPEKLFIVLKNPESHRKRSVTRSLRA